MTAAMLSAHNAQVAAGMMASQALAQGRAMRGEQNHHSYVQQASCHCDAAWGGYNDSCACGQGSSCDNQYQSWCADCGIGGYFGRGLVPVDSCTCGGTLVADLAIGIARFVDNSLSCLFGCLFGGLHGLGCHGTGSMAAYDCAAAYGDCCGGCGDYGCGGCGTEGYIEGEGFTAPMGPGPTRAVPQEADPFGDEPAQAPQARRVPGRFPFTSGGGSVRYQVPGRGVPPKYHSGNVKQSHFQQQSGAAVSRAAQVVPSDRSHLIPHRTATMRRAQSPSSRF
jgi:hypothetical protein